MVRKHILENLAISDFGKTKIEIEILTILQTVHSMLWIFQP